MRFDVPKKDAITHADLRRIFSYDPCGQLTYRFSNKKAKAGEVAGALGGAGYVQVNIDGKSYRVHRLIWCWHFGYFPENDLDHINGNKTDNRIENLREVSASCNSRNAKQRMSSSGVKGVSWCTAKNKWQAQLRVSGKLKHLGVTPCLVEAACLRLAAEQAEGWPACEEASPAFCFVRAYLKRRKETQ